MKNITFALGERTVATFAAGLIACGALGGWFLKSGRDAAPKTFDTSAAMSPATWHPAPTPLLTRFAASVSPSNVRPEYPRPQFVRQDWQTLNGVWEFGFDDDNVGQKQSWQEGKTFAERILVPFSFESALSGIGRGSEIHEHVWYRRTFKTPPKWEGGNILLHFGAVDWETTVWVNGHKVGGHRGGYTPFALDITKALRSGTDTQEIVVHVYDPSEASPKGWQPRGKQRGSSGIWYTRTTGIWQTVWLEPVAKTYISDITMTPSLSNKGTGTLALSASLPDSAVGMVIEASILDGSRTAVTQRATVSAGDLTALSLSVPQARPWTPESPSLYDIKLRLLSGDQVIDKASSYTAFRTVGISGGRLTLNGKPYFYRGVLDQGFWPDGIYTPPTDDGIKADVEAVKNLGFNMARKHIKVEDPRWYYWCDRLGVAVWQDMPSSQILEAPEAKEDFRQEWTEAIAATRNHPCVVHWIPFNENWGNPGEFQDSIVEMTRRLDPSRPITDASGWTQRSLTDVTDAHNYSNSLVQEGTGTSGKPKVVGEFGGVGLSVPGHIWAEGRVYIHAPDAKTMLSLVRDRTSQLYQAPNLSGFVYTQLTDVEHELNGMLTYDRQPKADTKAIAAIIEGRNRSRALPGLPIHDWLVLGPIPSGIPISRTDAAPNSIAQMAKVLDKSYLGNDGQIQPSAGQQTSDAGGGALTWQTVPGASIDFQKVFPGEMHANAVAYAVSYIDSPHAVEQAALYLGSDDGVVVWLNGKQIYRKVVIRGLKEREDTVSGLSLRKGRNILAVKVGQGQGGWGLSALLKLP